MMSDMSKIDFIGIGAPKCGTTWLSAQLEAHPQIGFAPDKEVYYFADTIMRRMAGKELNCFERGEAWYHEQFPALGGTITTRGEFCPSYLYLDEAADRIKAYRPDIKLLLCLRPPVEMIYSWYWYGRNAVIAKLPETFEGMMQESLPARRRMLRAPSSPLSRAISGGEFSRGSIRRDSARARRRSPGRLRIPGGRPRISNLNSKRARTRPARRVFRSSNPARSEFTAVSPRCPASAKS